MKVISELNGVDRDIEVARRVLRDEAAGLSALAECLDQSFADAVGLLAGATGRVVISGMGKSGHIAHKIAATMASTGTPAQYVNAGEAGHGDLGMITSNDVVVALSNSGETPELSDLVTHTKLHRIPLIAITGRAGSSLALAADVALVLPEIKEACSLNLAPTTSTTAMMALGDALAVVLFEQKGFSPEAFNALHPGGQLGRRFLKVVDIMHTGRDLPLVEAATMMSEALLVMTAKSFGCIGIVNAGGELVGIVTDGDLRRHMGDNFLAQTARDVMTSGPKTVARDTLAVSALALMNERKITSVFVVENEIPVGIVHIHDLLRAGIV